MHPFHQPPRLTPIRRFQPGDVVTSSRGPIEHRGIVSDCIGPDGHLMVISGSKVKGIVVEESMKEFSGGRQVRFLSYSGLPRAEIVAAARGMLGEPYHIFANNCEHIVTRANGLRPHSLQLRAAVAIGLVSAAVLASSKD